MAHGAISEPCFSVSHVCFSSLLWLGFFFSLSLFFFSLFLPRCHWKHITQYSIYIYIQCIIIIIIIITFVFFLSFLCTTWLSHGSCVVFLHVSHPLRCFLVDADEWPWIILTSNRIGSIQCLSFSFSINIILLFVNYYQL